MSIRVGHIVRHEDESGISGTGVVAEWIEYSDGEVVVHWLSHTPSTNHYRNLKQVEAIHGHGGKTEMITIWEQPRPDPSEEDSEEEDPKESLGEPGPLKKAPDKASAKKAPKERKVP